MKDGAMALTKLLLSIADHEPGPVACPHCLAPMESQGRRSKEVITLLGDVTVDRRYYSCTRTDCDGHLFPKDAVLDVGHTSFSPGVRMKKSGAKWSVRGANDIIALRCTLAALRFEDYWAERASA